MASQLVAKRYAKALSDLAEDSKSLQEVSKDFAKFATAFKNVEQLKEALLNPIFQLEQRQSVLAGVLDFLKIKGIIRNFMFVLLESRRFDHALLVNSMFQKRVDRKLGRINIAVTTARELDKKISKDIEEKINTLTKQKAKIDFKMKPSLLGGMTLQVGSVVFDATVSTQLETLAKNFRREL